MSEIPTELEHCRNSLARAIDTSNSWSEKYTAAKAKLIYYEGGGGVTAYELVVGNDGPKHKFTDEGICIRCGEDAEEWDAGCVEEMVVDLLAAQDHASISLARSASDGLAKEAAESALEATKRAIVRDLWPHLDFQYPQITFAIQRAGETIAAAEAEAERLAGLLREASEVLGDVWAHYAYPDKDGVLWAGGFSTLEWVQEFQTDIDAALAARDPQAATPQEK